MFTVMVVVLGLLLSWVATYAAGGSKTSVPHAFYIPVIIAAIRFGPIPTLLVSVTAAIASGPLMPLNVDASTTQSATNWLTRGLIFVVVGQITAYLVRHSMPSVLAELSGRRLHRELTVAIETDQLRLDYQPIVNIRAGGIAGVEALVRWDHPDRGLVAPADFVPHAERIGCIDSVTLWVVREALRQTAEWRTDVLAGATEFTVSVNLSASDVVDPALLVRIRDLLEQTGVPASWLHLEITETALMQDIDAAVEGLAALRSLGARIAMDDFGAGESSLGQLARLTVEVIKIDRSFVQQVERQLLGATLIGGIVELAHALGVVTVVEGIETFEEAVIVSGSGADLAQGYLFSRPVGPAEIEALLRDPEALCRRRLEVLGVGGG